MQNITVSELVELYDLQPHPEGGFFKETYRSSENYSTAIYFLIPEGKKSHLHRLKKDEVWHFYLGGPLTLIQIMPDGSVEEVVLGRDVKAGHKVQHVVPAGCWFGAYPNEGSAYSFVGCTVAPGFDFADFEMGNRNELLKQFPHAEKAITTLTD